MNTNRKTTPTTELLETLLQLETHYAKGVGENGKIIYASQQYLLGKAVITDKIKALLSSLEKYDNFLPEEDASTIESIAQEIINLVKRNGASYTPTTKKELNELIEQKIKTLGKTITQTLNTVIIFENLMTNSLEKINSATHPHLKNILSNIQNIATKIEEKNLESIEINNTLSKHQSIFLDQLNRNELELKKFLSQSEVKIQHANNESKKYLDEVISSEIEKLKIDSEKIIITSSEKINEIADQALAPAEKKANEYLNEIEILKSRTTELIGEISSGASSNHYSEAYRTERNSRIFWQTLSLIGFIFISIIIAKIFTSVTALASNEITHHDILAFSTRLTSIFACVFFISYCTKQSSKHHDLEKFNRQMRLELLTIDAYLSPITNIGEREKAKIQLKDSFFGQSTKLHSATETIENPNNALESINKIFEKICEFQSKK